tara:strand:+ start:337 stop:1026 length:690 start_codon:yes stop_codon:yes gene_type:complete
MFSRRAVLGAAAAVAIGAPAGVAQAELEDAELNSAAGLAKLQVTIEKAAELVEAAELDKLLRLIRSPVMTGFLGYVPVPFDPSQKLARDEEERWNKRSEELQLKLLFDFPDAGRRNAVFEMGTLLAQIRELDSVCMSEAARPQGERDTGRLRKCVEEVRAPTVAMTKLYFAEGCMVGGDPVRSVIASDATWQNPNLAVLDQYEPRLLKRPERTSEEEEYARKLGFRPDI